MKRLKRPSLRRPIAVICFLAVVTAGIAITAHYTRPGGEPPAASVVRTTDLVMQDRPDGSITVTQAGTGLVVDTLAPDHSA